ncbi:hypothetical protein ACOMHN_001530 [Nucella lapillus]
MALNKKTGSAHPNIWRLINVMRDDQASNEGLLRLCRGGQPPPAKRARYVDSARKLQALKTELDNQQRTLSDTAKMSHSQGQKAVIKNADMSEDTQQDAVECATQALEKFNIEKDIAAYIKKEFDKKYNPTWHCIVGRNFGSYVTHETKHFIYFYLGQVAILLFKSG